MSAIGEILNVALRAILGLTLLSRSPRTSNSWARIRDRSIHRSTALAQLLLSSAQELVGSRFASPVILPADDVDAAVQKVERVINTQKQKLRQLAADAALDMVES